MSKTLRPETTELEIPVSELRIGMHVIRLDKPWEETDFLMQGFFIHSLDDIDAVRSQCQTVVIEGKAGRPDKNATESRRKPVSNRFMRFFAKKAHAGDKGPGRDRHSRPETETGAAPPTRVSYINKVQVFDEMSSARPAYNEARALAKSVMAGLRVGRAIDLNEAKKVVNDCVDSILRNEDALLLLTKLKDKDEYTAEHSLNVSILSAAFGKHLGMLEEEIRTLGLCGLLHDVGKARVPDEILKKPGSLTPQEYAIMRKHATWGRDILMAVPKITHATIDVAYNHHERLDGKGYPLGIKATQIPYLAKVVAIVDTYDAISSSRAYGAARSSMEALKIIHRSRDGQFDSELTREFVLMVGIYPPGSIVEMTNGEVGIVIAANPAIKRRPRVMLVADRNKAKHKSYRTIDLSTKAADANGKAYVIAREVPDKTHGVSLKDYLEEGLVLGRTVSEDITP
ncbi:MAG: HD-GYP domain-containing protein [Oleiphilaceae bacterium]|nr:HD-GYP domain-containing protein [Oleiphilaceae bacterium]